MQYNALHSKKGPALTTNVDRPTDGQTDRKLDRQNGSYIPTNFHCREDKMADPEIPNKEKGADLPKVACSSFYT